MTFFKNEIVISDEIVYNKKNKPESRAQTRLPFRQKKRRRIPS